MVVVVMLEIRPDGRVIHSDIAGRWITEYVRSW